MPVGDAKLDELLALAEKATAGPWCEGAIYWALHQFYKRDDDCKNGDCDREGKALWHPSGDETAQLIARCSPEAIRALVEEIKAKRKAVSLKGAISTFQLSYEQDCEYGISDKDAAKGLREAFEEAGISYDNDAVFLDGKLSSAEEIAETERRRVAYAEQRNAWREAHPKEAARQDLIENQLRASEYALHNKIIDGMFSSNPIFNIVSSPHKQTQERSFLPNLERNRE